MIYNDDNNDSNDNNDNNDNNYHNNEHNENNDSNDNNEHEHNDDHDDHHVYHISKNNNRYYSDSMMLMSEMLRNLHDGSIPGKPCGKKHVFRLQTIIEVMV